MPSGSAKPDKSAGQRLDRGQPGLDRGVVGVQAHDHGARTRLAHTAAALARASHLEPALAVTVVAVLLAVAADVPPGRTVLVGAAVLAGQASIGWCNDWLDARRRPGGGGAGQPRGPGGRPPG